MPDRVDPAWKSIIEEMTPALVEFAAPDVFPLIDWSRGWLSLESELPRLMPKGKSKVLRVDKLIRVYLKDGTSRLLYIHFEVQGAKEALFDRRMFFYSARIHEAKGEFPLSIAILIDRNPNWRPGKFEAVVGGCSVNFVYPVVKLLDYEKRRAELEQSDKLFASILLAQLDSSATKGNPEQRLIRKTELMKALLRRGYAREYTRDVIRFMDWLMYLPPQFGLRCYNEMRNFEKEEHMPFVSMFEKYPREEAKREGKKEGKKEGKREGKKEGKIEGMQIILSNLLESKFGKEGNRLAVMLKEIDDSRKLLRISSAIVTGNCDLAEATKLIAEG